VVKTVIEERFVEVPEEVQVSVEGRRVTVSGPKGTLERNFSKVPVNIEVRDGRVRVWALWPRKKEIGCVGTVASHIRNMITGVTEGFTYRMKVVYVHFPVTVRVEGRKVIIENFLGERKPREAEIVGDVQVLVEGDDVIIRGIDKEAVGQTAANIEQATRVKGKDIRKFVDGIYVYEKKTGWDLHPF